jgi:hypothetical protein
VIEENGERINTTGPEKESSQNRTGGVSEGKAPFRKLSVRRTLQLEPVGPASNADAGPFSVYGK